MLEAFWERLEESERDLLVTARYPQDAPTACDCGHVGADVILGVCDRCAEGL